MDRGLGSYATSHAQGTGTARAFLAILAGRPWVVVTVPALGQGPWRAEHLFAFRQAVALYDVYHQQLYSFMLRVVGWTAPHLACDVAVHVQGHVLFEAVERFGAALAAVAHGGVRNGDPAGGGHVLREAPRARSPLRVWLGILRDNLAPCPLPAHGSDRSDERLPARTQSRSRAPRCAPPSLARVWPVRPCAGVSWIRVVIPVVSPRGPASNTGGPASPARPWVPGTLRPPLLAQEP